MPHISQTGLWFKTSVLQRTNIRRWHYRIDHGIRIHTPLSASQKTVCRAVLGALNYVANIGMFWMQAGSSLLLGELADGTVGAVK